MEVLCLKVSRKNRSSRSLRKYGENLQILPKRKNSAQYALISLSDCKKLRSSEAAATLITANASINGCKPKKDVPFVTRMLFENLSCLACDRIKSSQKYYYNLD